MQIFFKKQFFAAIRDGSKTTTIRRWPRAYFGPGSDAYSPHIGWLRIDQVEPVTLKQLGDADAKADGFDSCESMLKTLHELYPDHSTDGKQWFRVFFHVRELIIPKPRREKTQQAKMV